MDAVPDRCRLMLIAPEADSASALADMLASALSGGDVASVVLPQRQLDEGAFQRLCAAVVPVIQKAGAAALIAGDTRVAGRTRADGILVTGGAEEMAETVERHAPGMIVGGGNAKDRHTALAIGEAEPDFVFFGRIDGDIKPEPHHRNLALAEWWAAMIDIPCVVMGGSDAEQASAVAATGAEFVAFGKAVFAGPAEPGETVARINAALDEKAPRFGE